MSRDSLTDRRDARRPPARAPAAKAVGRARDRWAQVPRPSPRGYHGGPKTLAFRPTQDRRDTAFAKDPTAHRVRGGSGARAAGLLAATPGRGRRGPHARGAERRGHG